MTLALDAQLRETVERERRLAIRVAELETRRGEPAAEPTDGDGPAAPALGELTEQIQTLRIELEAARAREEELTAKTVHADGVMVDVGVRLAQLGEAADRVESLQSELAGVRASLEEATASAAEAASRVTEAEQRLGAAGAREIDLKETVAVTTLERDGAREELMRYMESEQTLTARITGLEIELERTTSETEQAIELARSEVETVRRELDESVRRSEQQLHDAHAELEVAAAAAASQTERAEAADGELTAVRRELTELQEATPTCRRAPTSSMPSRPPPRRASRRSKPSSRTRRRARAPSTPSCRPLSRRPRPIATPALGPEPGRGATG